MTTKRMNLLLDSLVKMEPDEARCSRAMLYFIDGAGTLYSVDGP